MKNSLITALLSAALLWLSPDYAMSSPAICPDLIAPASRSLPAEQSAAVSTGPSSPIAKSTTHVPIPEGKLETVTISLQRTECLGTCPDYSVVVKGNGSSVYTGRNFVLVTGHHDFKISETDVECLLTQFQKVDFWSLSDRYVVNAFDLPQYILTLSIGGQTKSVLDYGGFAVDMPGIVTALENEIDRVVSNRWTHGDSSTLVELRNEKLDLSSDAAASILANGATLGAPDDLILGLLAAGTAPTGRLSGPGWRPGSTAIEAASRNGRTAIVEALIARGALTKDISGVKEAALRAAAVSGDPRIVADILKFKPVVNEKGREGDTALIDMWGAYLYPRDKTKVDVPAIAHLLLNAGADPNIADRNGKTALFSARDANVVRILIKAGAKIDIRNKAGSPPLLSADTDEATVALIEAGADTYYYLEDINKQCILLRNQRLFLWR